MKQPLSANHPNMQAPRFSIVERDRRWAAVRKLMKERDIQCLLISHNTGEWDNYQSDTRYLSCIGGGGAATALAFPLEGEPIAIVREPRRIGWWREQQDWVFDVRAPSKFSWAAVFRDALSERGLTASRIGIVGIKDVLRDAEGTVAYGEIVALKSAFPNLVIESAIDILSIVRKRKSPVEIQIMRRAQVCADAISQAVREAARPHASEHDVYAAMMAAHIRAGGETPTMMLFNADSHMWQTHLLPRFRRLQADDVIMIEAEAKYFGYIVQSVETIALRPLRASETRLLDVSKECFDTVLAAMKPGVPYADLIALWEKTAAGTDHHAGRTMGHGLGQGQDLPLTTRGGTAGGAVVEEGDCFVLKPWIEDRAGTVSARVGANVVVESHGAKRIGQSDPTYFQPDMMNVRQAAGDPS
jgi:Xaa-Pro aminopeptidase